MDFDLLKELFPPKKKPVHKLKWGIPEARLCTPVEDAEKTVALVKKQGGLFAGGGEFLEEIHAKDFGNNTFAYYILRTDKRTQEETVHFDGYMLQEDEHLGMDVTSAFTVSKALENMGYKMALMRELEVWSLRILTRPVNVFEITDAGSFMEVTLPATKIAAVREKDEKWAEKFFEKMGVAKENIFPTDVITLQIVSMQQQPEPQA